jgi:hypothetical protein
MAEQALPGAKNSATKNVVLAGPDRPATFPAQGAANASL